MVETDFLEALLPPRNSPAASPAPWLKRLRAEALERAGALSVPTTREEDWRFTDLSALYKLKFQTPAGARPSREDVAPFHVAEAESRLVLVDGRFAPELSRIHAGDGAIVGSLSAALTADVPLEDRLGALARFDADVFSAVNTAFLQDAAIVYLPAGIVVDAPIQVLHVSTGSQTAAYPRVLVLAQRGAACTLIEDFVSLGGASYLANAVTEIFVEPNAGVRHIKLQREADTAFHIANTTVSLARDARYRNLSIALGARISRHNLNIVQSGEGIDCEVDGLAMIAGRQLADTHSLIDHAHAAGRSRQLHKTVVGGAGHAVFNGKIFVRPGAQRTDSAQESRNLLLTPRAHVDTKPQLEIFADDVKCTHGATVGQIDAEEVFYLKSRGLSESAARNLLIYAFAAEVVTRIPVPSLVTELERAILAQTQEIR